MTGGRARGGGQGREEESQGKHIDFGEFGGVLSEVTIERGGSNELI